MAKATKQVKGNLQFDLEDLLGLKDTTIDVEVDLTQDLLYVMEHGIDKYNESIQKHEEEKRKFVRMFKECYDELCMFMEMDPKRRVPISCYTCQRGMDLRDQYGKYTPKKHK